MRGYLASLPQMETGILYQCSLSCHATFGFVCCTAFNRCIKEHYDIHLPCFAFYSSPVCVLLSCYKDDKNWSIYIRTDQNAYAVRDCDTTGSNVSFCSHDSGRMAMVNQALRLRGLAWNWHNVFTRPIHMLEYMMVPFLMQSSVVVDEMSAAVMARGFDRDTRRSSYIEVKLSFLDWCIVVVSAGILAWNLIV